MKELKTYYRNQAEEQRESSFTVTLSNAKRRRPVLKTALIAAAMVITTMGLSVTAYAFVQRFVQQADTGQSAVLKISPTGQNGFSSVAATDVESTPEEEFSYFSFYFDNAKLNVEDEIKLQFDEYLRDKHNNQNNEPMSLELKEALSGHGIQITENFYDKNGNIKIDIIWSNGFDKVSVAAEIRRDKCYYSYDEIVSLYGQDFRIPKKEGFEVDEFKYSGMPGDDRTAVYVEMTNDADQSIWYFVEKTRDDDEEAKMIWYVSGTIEEWEINGITVYKQIDADGQWGRTMWQMGENSYCLFYSDSFGLTEQDYEEIIASMLE